MRDVPHNNVTRSLTQTPAAPSFAGATQKLTANLGSILLTNYKIWPLLNFVSFSYVPKDMRVLFNNVLSVFWNIFLCAKLA